MIKVDTINHAFQSLVEAGQAGVDVCSQLEKAQYIVNKNNDARTQSEALFVEPPDIDNLSREQRDWFDDYSNWALSDVCYRAKQFLGRGISYYMERKQHKGNLEAAETRGNSYYQSYHKTKRELEEMETTLSAVKLENEHLCQCNDTQKTMIEERDEKIRGFDIREQGYQSSIEGLSRDFAETGDQLAIATAYIEYAQKNSAMLKSFAAFTEDYEEQI
jgi:hypothetical protein